MQLERIKEVEISITTKLESANEVPSKPFIFEVPECVRKGKEEFYSPIAVTIGPIHYQNPPEASMQAMKLKHLANFLQTEGNPYALQDYIKMIGDKEEDIRGCYEKKITFPSNVLIELLLIDAAFIVDFIVAMSDPLENFSDDKLRFLSAITQDLLLLENQLPFFVLESLYNIAYCVADPETSFIDHSCFFLLDMMCIPGVKPTEDAAHETEDQPKESKIKHLLDLLRLCWLPSKLRDSEDIDCSEYKLSATASVLKAVGIKFETTESKNLLDISFQDGVLEIPKFILNDSSEKIFRNLIAHEQCLYIKDSYVIDYLAFLDWLIDTPEDVRILGKSGIIQNELGDTASASQMYNGMGSSSMLYTPNFYYAQLSCDLNSFAQIPCNRWIAVLRKDYFKHPWAIISVVYLILLLVLTVLQVITGFKN